MRVPIVIALFALAASTIEAANVRIQGLRVLTEQEALDLMAGRLTFIAARPANAARADDAAYILQNLLRTRGLTEAEVDWKIEGDDILLKVDEGAPILLGEIDVEGTSPELAGKVRDQFRSAHAVNSRTLDRVPYLESQNSEALSRAAKVLHADGFWSAAVELAGSKRDRESGRVAVQLEVNPGPLFRLALPRVTAGSVRQPEIEAQLHQYAMEPATAPRIREARRTVEQYFRNAGYQFAKVDMLADERNDFLALDFRVQPGQQYVVGNITVTGTETVEEDEVRERFSEFTGDRYRAEDIEKEIRKLYATGAFEAVRLEETPREDGTLDLNITIKEAKPDGYYFYGGFGTLEGLILGAGYYHRNLFGQLWDFSGSLELSAIGGLGEVRVTEPRFAGEDIAFSARGYALSRLFDGYDRYEFGGDVEAVWESENDYTARLYFRNAFVTTSPDGLPSAALGPTNYFVHRLGFEQTLDKRNSPVLPTDGYFLGVDNEIGLTVGGDSVSFFRTDAQASFFQPITDDGHLAFNTKMGFVIPAAGSDDLPIDLRYFIGGANSMRGFPERELGPLVNGYPSGGEAFWFSNLEYIHSVTSILNGVVFADAGNMNSSFDEFGSGRTVFALGAGVRLDLPLGPVRFEYGHNLNPGVGDPKGAFHFAIGASF